MAAKPIERFVKRQIQDQGGWPRILERIASGETFSQIAGTLLRPDGQPISFAFFRALLHRDPEREPAIREAKRVRAEAWADQAKAYSESVPPSRDDVAKARVWIDTRLRLASFADREAYGEAKGGVNVTFNVPTLHVDALRHRVLMTEEVGPQITSGSVPQACARQEGEPQSALQPLALPTPSAQQDP